MREIDQSDVLQPEPLEGEIVNDRPVGCTDLVPLATTTHWAPKIPLPHADPSFVTQLIASAEHAPQTRTLRRGSPADAWNAYAPHVSERRSVTRRTRQII
jgi:hypothetical protein